MTDRELLEKAAKAAGIEVEWDDEEFADLRAVSEGMFLKGKRSPDNSKYWNPLTDDGDALRLAVKLRIRVEWWKNGVEASHPKLQNTAIYETEDDPYSTTRRAIVRAAAAIGETL